jgi:ribosome-binding protein aMBF1 (putative translation factor)
MSATTRTKAHQRIIAALIDARHKSGLPQWKVAKKLGHSQTWLARIETGERRLDLVELGQLCRLYGIDPVKLVGKLGVNGD